VGIRPRKEDPCSPNMDSTASPEPCPPKSAAHIYGPSVDQCGRRTAHPPAFGIAFNELCPLSNPVDFYWGHLPADSQTSPLIQDILNTEEENLGKSTFYSSQSYTNLHAVSVYLDSLSRDRSPWSQTVPLNPLTERLTTEPARVGRPDSNVKVEPFELSLPPHQYLPVASTSSSHSPFEAEKRDDARQDYPSVEALQGCQSRVTSLACTCQPSSVCAIDSPATWEGCELC
jgi:hypothetical protein